MGGGKPDAENGMKLMTMGNKFSTTETVEPYDCTGGCPEGMTVTTRRRPTMNELPTMNEFRCNLLKMGGGGKSV